MYTMSRKRPVVLVGSTEGFRLQATDRRVPCDGGDGVSNSALFFSRSRGSSSWWRPRLLGRGVLAYLACRCVVAPAKASWIDPDTLPQDRHKNFESDKRDFDLVFSDEFNREGRTFHDGRDPRWTAIHKNDYTNHALQFYSHDMVETRDGRLIVTTNNSDITFKFYDTPRKRYETMHKTYVSGMVQGWNKFCFTGGIVEIRAILPGDSDVGGLWPAMWLMGNLARATFTASSDFTWPWSYNKCNRTTDEKADWQRQQEVSACDASVHYGFHPSIGRGAPEIDIMETMGGTKDGMPFMSTSLQVAPGTGLDDRPQAGKVPPPGTWYEKGIHYGPNSTINKWFYGVHLKHKLPGKSYFADAVSGNHLLEPTHFEDLHTYRLDWQPGGEGRRGYIRWFLDDVLLYGIDDDTLSFHGAQIPEEPAYLLLNTAVSDTWGFPVCTPTPSCTCDCWDVRDPACECAVDPGLYSVFPAEFVVDWVRVYQAHNDSSHTLGCNPEEYPTRDFIKANTYRYKDPDDEHVMLPVATGGGSCRSSSDCNGNECSLGNGKKRCECGELWTGPNCRAAATSDNFSSWEEASHRPYPMHPPSVPPALLRGFLVLAVAFGVTLAVRYRHRRERQKYVNLDESCRAYPSSETL